MDNLRKSKRIALGIVNDAKEALDDLDVDYDVKIDVGDLNAVPSTSRAKPKRPTEIIKYGKITFNTTAILHHYPQLNVANECENTPVQIATKKSDLNLPLETNSENNNQIKDKEIENTADVKKKDNFNNNAIPKIEEKTASNKAEVANKPLKFTEEKLV